MASKRRPTLPDDLDLDEIRALPGAALPQRPFHERASTLASDEKAPQPQAALGLKEKAINMSIYLLPDDHRRLRRLAADEDTSIQALVLDGIDHVLQQRGQGRVTRWETRRKPRG
jgi:hypothetical protein